MRTASQLSPAGIPNPDALRAAAMQFLGRLSAEVSSGTVDLPCFPDVVLRIRKALADPKNTLAKTVIIVGAEPRLAALLLQTANSAAFNPVGRQFTDLRTAITRLGHQLVQSAAMAFAVKQIKHEPALRSIAEPLSTLWKESISVALMAQLVAKRTRVTPDTAFLTGLLHGIGRLYVMVRAVDSTGNLNQQPEFLEMVTGWQASIGKAVLENWGFADEMCEAVAEQRDYQRPLNETATLTDVLIVSIVLGDALGMPDPRVLDTDGIAAFVSVGLSPQDCAPLLAAAEQQIGSLQELLGA